MTDSTTNAEPGSTTSPAELAPPDAVNAPPHEDPPSDQASGEKVFEALYERFGDERAVSNQRLFERFPWVTDLTIWVEDPAHSERVLAVTTHDVSRGGFSFVYKQFLYTGTSIRTRFNGLPSRPIIKGVVRDCVDVGDSHHRVGVEFTQASSTCAEPKS